MAVTLQQPRFRITLWDRDANNGFRGTQKAVVFDAKNIGIEEAANDTGSAYWTLDNDHPQIAEFVPLTRHYEISRWSDTRSRWEFVAAGILNDYTATDTQTTFSGLDYMSIMNMRFSSLDGYSSTGSGYQAALGAALTTASPLDNAASTAYINSADLVISDYTNYTSAGKATFLSYTSNSVSPSYDQYGQIPYIRVAATAVWQGATTSGFSNKIHWVIRAVEGTTSDDVLIEDGYALPLSQLPNVVAEVDIAQTSFTSYVDLNFWARDALDNRDASIGSQEEYIAQGGSGIWGHYGINAWEQWNNTTYDYYLTGGGYNRYIQTANLYAQSQYKFIIYAAIQRTSTGVWYRSDPVITPAIYPVQQIETAATNVIISNLVTSTINSFERTLPHQITVSGTTTTDVIDFRTAGQPLLDAIARVCDLQMGTRVDKAKTIFGIKKPISGNSYTGGWEIKLNISSAATTAFSLRYPDNISAFSYTPGGSRIKTNVYIIGSVGKDVGQNVEELTGLPVVAASAVAASGGTYGNISQLVPISGYLPSSVAQKEASRFAVSSKPENTKGLSVRLSHDAVELWDGWDVGDSVNVYISKGPVVVNEPFVISAVQWFGDSNGSERIQLQLVQASAFGARFGG